MRLLAAAAQRHGVPLEELAASLNSEPPSAPVALPTPRVPIRETSPGRVPEPAALVPVSPQAPAAARPPLAPPQSRLRAIAPPPPRIVASTSPNSNSPLVEEIDPATRTLRVALTFGSIVLVGLVLGLASIWMVVTGLTTPPTKPAAITAAPPAKPAPVTPHQPDKELFPSAAAPVQANREKTGAAATLPIAPLAPDADPVTLVRTLGSCVEQLGSDPVQALDRFKDATHRLGNVWPALAPDQLVSAQNSIVEFMYQSGKTDDLAARAAAFIAADAQPVRAPSRSVSKDQILPSVWAMGIVTRLTSERDLPADARSAISTAAGATAGQGAGTFSAGAASAIVAWPAVLARATVKGELGSPAIEIWREWLRAVEAVGGTDQPARTRLVMNGLEALLTDGPEPVDPALVTALVRAVGWRPDDESRPRFLRWFESAAISSNDLRAATTALAGDSGAAGVDPTMVLALPADEPQRLELREKYAVEWGLRDGPARDSLVLAWAAAAKSFLEQPDQPALPSQQLARAVILSRLSESASLILSGQQQGVGDAIRDADKAIVALLADAATASPPRSLDENTSDGVWAIEYLSAEKNPSRRAELLTKLGTTGTIGQVDAEVLAAEAFRGSPTSIRQSAQALAAKFALSPAMVNAALEQSVNIPRTNENADLARTLSLASLPALRDPGWRAAVRRGLVTRLLEMVASRGDQGLVDRLADLLSVSYRSRAVSTPSEAKHAPSERVSPEVAARVVRASWLRWAQALTPSGPVPLSLDQTQRRMAGRSRLASGMIQEFAAEQVGTAELMAFVVAVEQPGSAAEVTALLERLGNSRRNADHIFSQMLATERAMIELWAIRLGVSLS